MLNRLTERGLLEREREGRGFVYRPKLTEAEYLSGSIRRTLAGASSGARQAALANIIGGLRPEELSELEDLARQARDARNRDLRSPRRRSSRERSSRRTCCGSSGRRRASPPRSG